MAEIVEFHLLHHGLHHDVSIGGRADERLRFEQRSYYVFNDLGMIAQVISADDELVLTNGILAR